MSASDSEHSTFDKNSPRLGDDDEPMSEPDSSGSGEPDATPENEPLQLEYAPSEARRLFPKLTSRDLHVRVISGFRFTRGGLLWQPTPAAVKNGDLAGVILSGFVATLANIPMRPIVESGYWDLKGFNVERYFMNLVPRNIYADTNPIFRKGEWAMWAETEEYVYVLACPGHTYNETWREALKAKWRRGHPAPVFRDLTPTGPRAPAWWPSGDQDRLKEVRRQIQRIENKASHADKSNNNPQPRKDKRRAAQEGPKTGGGSQASVSKRKTDEAQAGASKRANVGRGPPAVPQAGGSNQANSNSQGSNSHQDQDTRERNTGGPRKDTKGKGKQRQETRAARATPARPNAPDSSLGAPGETDLTSAMEVDSQVPEQAGPNQGPPTTARETPTAGAEVAAPPLDTVISPCVTSAPTNQASHIEPTATPAVVSAQSEIRAAQGAVANQSSSAAAGTEMTSTHLRDAMEPNQVSTTVPSESTPPDRADGEAPPPTLPSLTAPASSHAPPMEVDSSPGGASAGLPNAELPAGTSSPKNALTTEERALVHKLMPTLSFTTPEAALIGKNQDLSSEFPLGDVISIYEGRVVLQIGHFSGSMAREPYLEQPPWNSWHYPKGISTARILLTAGSQSLFSSIQRFLEMMPASLPMKLYAAAVFIPEQNRGPLQRRLVSLLAIMAREEKLPPKEIREWILIHQALDEWKLKLHDLPTNHEAPLPDFSSCYT